MASAAGPTLPGGVFEFYRQVEGIRESALGSMWNPVYFNYGIAIHGALNVPLKPASHGCIRIPLKISENLQSHGRHGRPGLRVGRREKEPEEYGDQAPPFNWLDPDYVSTTTTSVPESTTPTTATTAATDHGCLPPWRPSRLQPPPRRLPAHRLRPPATAPHSTDATVHETARVLDHDHHDHHDVVSDDDFDAPPSVHHRRHRRHGDPDSSQDVTAGQDLIRRHPGPQTGDVGTRARIARQTAGSARLLGPGT